MPRFTYSSIDKNGKKITGSVEASSKSAASKILFEQKIRVLGIKEEKKGGFDPNNIKIPGLSSGKVKTKDLVIFTRQLSTMINAGVPLVRSLSTLQSQTENESFKEIMELVSRDVESGISFAEALRKHPQAFSPIYVNMVAAGEAGGILDDILKRLAIQQEKESSMRKKVKSASTYPTILMVITIGAFFGLMIFVIPTIGGIITDLGGEDAELPPQTKAMIAISDFMIKQWYIMLAGMIGGVIAFKRWKNTKKGRYRWHAILLKIPVVKTIVSKVAIARFARTFASLMSSGVGVLDALQVTGAAIGNDVIEAELQSAAQEVKNGHQLSEPIAHSAIFPPIVSQMLAIGEETGQIDTILLKVADFYEEEVDTVIDSLSSIIEPIMIVVMGGMVGLIAASVMGPIASLSQNI